MAELTSMMNIGREMSRKLASVGIDTAEELIFTGAREAFSRLKKPIQTCVWCTFTRWRAQ